MSRGPCSEIPSHVRDRLEETGNADRSVLVDSFCPDENVWKAVSECEERIDTQHRPWRIEMPVFPHKFVQT